MDEENSSDGIFNRNFGHGHLGVSPTANISGRRHSVTRVEDSTYVMFDVADEEDLHEPNTPSGSYSTRAPQLTFGSVSMQYFNKKHMNHDCEDMDSEHADKMHFMELTHAPDLTEHELSRSFDEKIFQQHFQAKDSSKNLGDVARVASDLAKTFVNPDETKETEHLSSQSSKPMTIPIPQQLPGKYQNSKILSAFYSQTSSGSGQLIVDNSPVGSLASSPNRERAATMSPHGSPSEDRKAMKSKVKNRDVNVWAPGSM